MDTLFGTDGIRGRAYEPPLDEETVRRLGVALAEDLALQCPEPRILLAGDTRASTTDLARWLASSFQATGGSVTWAGVLPTPAVSHLLRQDDCAAGVVISASHNPAQDNGIKILGPGGEKLADDHINIAVAPDGTEWLWVLEAAPAIDIDGRSLAFYLDWVARETGWQIRYADEALERSAETIVLHGTIEDLRPDESLSVILEGSGLYHLTEDGAILIVRP